MARVKTWQNWAVDSGTSTVVESETGTLPGEFFTGDTLLRTLAGCTVTAYASIDPLGSFAGHSQMMFRLWQSTDGSAPSGPWPYPSTQDDEILTVPLMPMATTVYPAGFVSGSVASTSVHFGHSPSPAESKAMRTLTSDFAPCYWYVGGADSSPNSGLTLSVRFWVRQLWERAA